MNSYYNFNGERIFDIVDTKEKYYMHGLGGYLDRANSYTSFSGNSIEFSQPENRKWYINDFEKKVADVLCPVDRVSLFRLKKIIEYGYIFSNEKQEELSLKFFENGTDVETTELCCDAICLTAKQNIEKDFWDITDVIQNEIVTEAYATYIARSLSLLINTENLAKFTHETIMTGEVRIFDPINIKYVESVLIPLTYYIYYEKEYLSTDNKNSELPIQCQIIRPANNLEEYEALRLIQVEYLLKLLENTTISLLETHTRKEINRVDCAKKLMKKYRSNNIEIY